MLSSAFVKNAWRQHMATILLSCCYIASAATPSPSAGAATADTAIAPINAVANNAASKPGQPISVINPASKEGRIIATANAAIANAAALEPLP